MDPSSSFGARLRAQRERQQVALSTISENTKIKVSMLEGLERDDVSQWPEGIFRRAYVRSYASAVGLDPESLVREFLEVHPDPVVTPPPQTGTELEDPEWPAGFRRLVTSAMAVIPSRRQRVTSALPASLPEESASEASPNEETPVTPKPVRPGTVLNLLFATDVGSAPDDERAGSEPELSAFADDDDYPAQELVGSESSFSADGYSPLDAAERRPELSLQAAAELCTRLGRVLNKREVAPILEDAAIVLDAVGLIVWTWDSRTAALKPSLAYGYTDALLARMPRVRSDGNNAIATAFQSGRPCVVNGGGEMTGAVVVPLTAHDGCAGVLAVELQYGDEQRGDVLAFATILAAQLVTLVGSASLAQAVNA